MSSVFRLNDREARPELYVQANGQLVLDCRNLLTSALLWVKDSHLLTTLKIVAWKDDIALLRRLVGSGWVVDAYSLRVASPALLYSVAAIAHLGAAVLLTLF